LKLVIDDACYAYHKIFSEFGEIVAMAGRDIDANSVQDADVRFYISHLVQALA
jgi:erythronate-4-phosphate dehydrogenase